MVLTLLASRTSSFPLALWMQSLVCDPMKTSDLPRSVTMRTLVSCSICDSLSSDTT